MFFDDKARHEKMARLDPRDLNGDGVVTPEEASAYIRDYMNNASPEERQAILRDYLGGLSATERQQMGEAIVKSPANPVESIRHDDDNDLIDAFTRTAQAPVQQGRNPLEAAFNPEQIGKAMDNPLIKAGLIGLAAAIGSKVLRPR